MSTLLLLEGSMRKLIPKGYTSGHSGKTGGELVGMKWKWDENPYFLLNTGRLGMGHSAFRIELHYTKAGWRKPNLTAVDGKTTQECKLTTRLIEASSVTLPFKRRRLCWAVVWPQLEYFCPVLVQMLKRMPTKWSPGWMLMDQEIIS